MRYPPFLSVNQIFVGSPTDPSSTRYCEFLFPFLFFSLAMCLGGPALVQQPLDSLEGPARLDHQFGLERTSSDCVAMLTPVDASASRLFPSQLASARRCSGVIRA
ncbi:hypothetical protein LB506_002474 [Fusarium annulatum]|nr:hypothetical protein LB506_002474 [Fusarium annulatum]